MCNISLLILALWSSVHKWDLEKVLMVFLYLFPLPLPFPNPSDVQLQISLEIETTWLQYREGMALSARQTRHQKSECNINSRELLVPFFPPKPNFIALEVEHLQGSLDLSFLKAYSEHQTFSNLGSLILPFFLFAFQLNGQRLVD